MIDTVLKNLVNLFYPKSICFTTQNSDYIASDEYKRLQKLTTDFASEHWQDLSREVLEKFEKDYTLKNFTDFTLFDWGDRCTTFNVNVIEDGELYTLSLLLSVIVPYYVIDCKKNKTELFFSESEIATLQKANKETRKIKDLIFEIENIVEDKLLYCKFPEDMINLVIEDVSFQEAGFGNFKMFNAFFNNIIIDRNEK